MCAAAGIPILPEPTKDSEDGEDMETSEYADESMLDYQDSPLHDDGEEDTLHDEETDSWSMSSSRYPLKKRYLQLLCGSESESEQYHNAIDYWTPNDPGSLGVNMHHVMKVVQVIPQRKRGFELFGGDDGRSETGSRPRTEEIRSKKRWDSGWAKGAIVSGAGDYGSE